MLRAIHILSTTTLLTLSLGVPLASAQPPEDHAAPKVRDWPEDLSADETEIAGLYERVLPAVVTILVEGTRITEEGPAVSRSLGSGVLISPDCHVLTAAHVVEDADTILVETQDGKKRPAEHLFSESDADIALLRLLEPDQDLAHAELGDSDRLAVGQRVVAIGSPYGLVNTLSVGRISAFRDFGRLYDGTILAEFIQTDAAINSGNSGGPLFDSRGRVIGIASRIFTESGGSQGLGFAVAVNTAKQLLALEERAWMGFQAVFLDSETLKRLFNLDYEGALLVQTVTKSSPADRAGLRGGVVPASFAGQDVLLGGDLILSMGNQEACHEACLVRAKEEFGESPTVTVRFLRDGVEEVLVLDVSQSRHNFLED